MCYMFLVFHLLHAISSCLTQLLLVMCVKRFMVASTCNAILFWSLAHGLDITYYKFQWVVNCPPQDNKNIHKAYKESRDDDHLNFKMLPKANYKCAKAPIPCLMPFLTSLLWCLLIPKWVSIIFNKMTFIFIFWVINIWEDPMYVVPTSYGLKCNILTSKDHVSKVGEVMSLVRRTFEKINMWWKCIDSI